MIGDMSSLPISGGAVMGGLIYGAISLFATGPLVGERLVEKSNWSHLCAKKLIGEISANQPKPQFVPKLDCKSTFGMFGQDGRALCNRYGNFNIPFLDQLSAHQKKLAKDNQKRVNRLLAKTTNRCSCAASVMLEKRRSAFAIYAGSLRLIKPTSVQNMETELVIGLQSQSCKFKD